MLFDLNIPWTPTTSSSSLEKIISFQSELGYNTIALSYTQSDKSLPSKLTNPIPIDLPLNIPPKTIVLRRCTLTLSDPAHNHRLSSLASLYDILAIRPTNEKAFLAACLQTSEHSIISLDLTTRYPFHFKPKTLMTAINRGIMIEICYSQCITADTTGRRNFISNLLSVTRCTKGRGLIISSEASNVMACRGVADITNLLGVWGLSRERAVEGFSVHPRGVVVNEKLKRSGYRGIINVIDGGPSDISSKSTEKRAIETDRAESNPSFSKRAAKRAKMKEHQEKLTMGTNDILLP
ncbi:unnamed protein product [Blumeria hordei]|uniref:Uncharacterized protein n=2 Tax=Blumeria hordei TaxID=2867405 RepID=A0A383UN19_BLUHO|nr:ribonuclease P complex subunit Pop2 [Blumeria hordei DH14]SZF01098.1 unnamed protein product [Blumeria hordei]